MKAINLDGVVMYVSSTDHRGVVDAKTRLYFAQKKGRESLLDTVEAQSRVVA